MLILRYASKPSGYTWFQPLLSKFLFQRPFRANSLRHCTGISTHAPVLLTDLSPSGAKSRMIHKVKEEPAAEKSDRRLIDSRQSTPLPDLKSVADHVGGGVTPDGDTLSENDLPPVVKNSRGRWSESETNLLTQLVEEQESSPPIKWTYIAEKLHRTRAQCYSRWKTLQYKPRGDFTEAEDALILETVGSGEKGPSKGLWTSLSDQLQRDNRIVYNRYRALLVPPSAHTKKKKIIRWTAEMNAALAEARVDPPDASWSDVAARLQGLGYNVSGDDCRWHWFHYLKGVSAGQRSLINWTPEEVAQLLQLRNEKILTWKEIGQQMNILPRACYDKYKILSLQHLKRGPYAAEEDECILRAVDEWGDPRTRRGLWNALQKKMHRPAANLRMRWRYLIANAQVKKS